MLATNLHKIIAASIASFEITSRSSSSLSKWKMMCIAALTRIIWPNDLLSIPRQRFLLVCTCRQWFLLVSTSILIQTPKSLFQLVHYNSCSYSWRTQAGKSNSRWNHSFKQDMYMYSRSQIKVHVSSSYYDRNTKRSYSSFQPFKRYAAILFQNAHALTTPLC